MSNALPVTRLLLTTREAAETLSISERTLWTLTNSGAVESVRIGRAVRYSVEDLRNYIERNRTGRIQNSDSSSEGNSHGQH